jgi:hypothetical protein
MVRRVTITIRGWDEHKAWLGPTAYPATWLKHRLLSAGLIPRQAKKIARQYGRRETLTFPPLYAKNQFELDSFENFARQLGNMGAIVEVEVVAGQ